MTATFLYSITGFIVFLIGVCGLLFHPSMIRRTLALNVTGAGIFLFMVSQAYRGEAEPPDPVPHGLVLTGIVIAAGATALMLFLIGEIFSAITKNDERGEAGS